MVVAALLNVSATFMNGGAGTGLVDFFHGFQVALMMTVMLNLTQFVWWRCKQSRRGSCLSVHAPTLWTLAATILVNIQPMWILIIGSWHLCCSTNEQLGQNSSWNPGGYSFPPWANGEPRPCKAPGGNVFWDVSYCGGKELSTFPTVWSGWVVQIVFTWGGFVCMFIGVLMATQLHVKLRKQWRSLRNGTRA
jgi:hypothetical protein